MRRFVPGCCAFAAMAGAPSAASEAAPSPLHFQFDRLSRTPLALRSRTRGSSIECSSIEFEYRSNCGGGGAPVAM